MPYTDTYNTVGRTQNREDPGKQKQSIEVVKVKGKVGVQPARRGVAGKGCYFGSKRLDEKSKNGNTTHCKVRWVTRIKQIRSL